MTDRSPGGDGSGVAGTVATAAPFGATLAAVVGVAAAIPVDPDWRVRGHALSDLGAVGASDPWLFDGTPVLAGALGAVGALGSLGATGLPRSSAGPDLGRWLAAGVAPAVRSRRAAGGG